MGNYTANSVWKSALAMFKTEQTTPGKVKYFLTDKVESAYNECVETGSADENTGYSSDSLMKLSNMILKAYGLVYTLSRNEEYQTFASSLALVAAKYAAGKNFRVIISKYDPEQSRDRSFLLYFHTIIRKKFISFAEKERSTLNGPGYVISEISQKKYRIATEYTNREFGCKPEDCNLEEFKKLLEYLNSIKNLSKTSEQELKLIIEENSVKPKPTNEKDNNDPIGNISDDPKKNDEDEDEIESESESDRDFEAVNIKATDTQMHYFGIYVTHRYLDRFVSLLLSKKHEKNLTNIDAVLRSETEKAKEAYAGFVTSGLEKFNEGADDVCRIAAESLKNGRGFPAMKDITDSLEIKDTASINHAHEKIVKRLEKLLPH